MGWFTSSLLFPKKQDFRGNFQTRHSYQVIRRQLQVCTYSEKTFFFSQEKNRTFCALNSIALPDPFPSIKEKVAGILTESGYSDQRSRMMEINDFLK
jgi:hypothetical protein